METFSALLALCAGNSLVPVNSLHKGQWRGALVFSLICSRINDWVNNHEAGDWRCHRGHYDVNVMDSWQYNATTPCLQYPDLEYPKVLYFSCDQAALWMVQSVCPSVTPFWLCSPHRIITKVITNDKSDIHAKSQGQRSKVKVTG